MVTSCQRCGHHFNPGESHTMSRFNTQEICNKCEETEIAHPAYEAAKDAELEQCRKGNFNYEGIGLPDDLKRQYFA